MDVFDRSHICNHTDEGGRYMYKVKRTRNPSAKIHHNFLFTVPAEHDVGVQDSNLRSVSHRPQVSTLSVPS